MFDPMKIAFVFVLMFLLLVGGLGFISYVDKVTQTSTPQFILLDRTTAQEPTADAILQDALVKYWAWSKDMDRNCIHCHSAICRGKR